MNKIFTRILIALFIVSAACVRGQTLIPNGSLETWINHGNYDDPQYWDTPNQETSSIPFFGVTVVTKSSDHEDGTYSAKLETKHITLIPLNIPGVITLGNLTIDLTTLTFSITGGAPITDSPTHLFGFFKFFPQGNDSCAIGIALFKTIAGVADTVAYGSFSATTTVPDWTPFSAWINYLTTDVPDTMNVLAISSAMDTATAGTILYVDNLTLDYTLGIDPENPETGVKIYQDRETGRILLFFDFAGPQETSYRLYNVTGQAVRSSGVSPVTKEKQEISYAGLPKGLYILEILHDNKKLTRKFILNF
jgi:hypothetical protein